VSSEELVQAQLGRIAAVNPALNAVVQVNGSALAQARTADEARARGQRHQLLRVAEHRARPCRRLGAPARDVGRGRVTGLGASGKTDLATIEQPRSVHSVTLGLEPSSALFVRATLVDPPAKFRRL
jgi:hypothetical protein